MLCAAPLHLPVSRQWSLALQQFLLLVVFVLTLFFIYSRFCFSYDSCCSLFFSWIVFVFLKLVILIVCFLKESKKFCMQLSSLYASCVFSILTNAQSVGIEYLQEIYSSPLVMDEFPGSVLHPSTFLILPSKSRIQDKLK